MFKQRFSHQLRTRNSLLGRRKFLLAASGLTFSGIGAQFVSPNVAGADQPNVASTAIDTTPASDLDLMRVRIEMKVMGNVNVPSDPLVSRQSKLTLPIQSDALFDYEERYRRPVDADPRSAVTAIERYYHESKSSSRLNRSDSSITLRDSVRQTQVRRDSLPETIYAVDDYFTHDELALLRIPVSSVSIDQLLPTTPIRVGDQYEPTDDALASVLNLSSIQTNDVSARVADIDASLVRFQLKGKVEGSVEGVPTTIHLLGKLNFDREVGTCSWLAMAVHEIREIGKAEPGFDVSATIKMVRQPLPRTIGLPVSAPAITSAIPQDRLYIDLRSERVGVSAVMDRRWRMMTDQTGSAMLRMIENDRSIAQCNLRPLARLQPGKQWTLEAFQADVRQTLGNELEQLIEADQRLSASELRVLRVVAQGAVEGVPIQWVMLHFSDDSGRRVLATFTMSGDAVETFAGADLQLADSLRFVGSTTADPASDQTEAADPESGGLESGGPSEEVAKARSKTNDREENEVQSASDLR